MERFKIITDEAANPGGGCDPGCGCASEAAETAPEPRLELEEVRERLADKTGPRYWKSFEELAATPEFDDMLAREFPSQAFQFGSEVSRRRFLQLGSASLALAGMTACTRQPTEKIIPYVEQPEQLVPGEPMYFATAFPMGGFAQGVLVESHMGRPTKVEGNPDHPANPGGGTDLFAQASILQLYDPERSDTVLHFGEISTWDALATEMAPKMTAMTAAGGAGLRILTPTVTSPTLVSQIRSLMEQAPDAVWHQFDPAGQHNAFAGTQAAFGSPRQVRYDLSQADVILALDSDFLTQGPGAVAHAHAWAERRRVPDDASSFDGRTMSRLYAVESMPSNTGSVADHRLALKPSEIVTFARAVAASVGAGGGGAAGGADLPAEVRTWVDAIASDLQAAGGNALVVPGDSQSGEVHALALRINQALGAVGNTVQVSEPVAGDPVDQLESITELTRALEAGEVDLLVVIGSNPVFDAPADLRFADAMAKAGEVIHMGLYRDETGERAHWHLPQSHYLESWSDARSVDGTVSIIQPLIDPLYRSKTAHELLSLLAGEPAKSAYDIVRDQWRSAPQVAAIDGDFERAWATILHDGFIGGTGDGGFTFSGTPVGASTPASAPRNQSEEPGAAESLGPLADDELEIVFRADPTIHDGSWANNGWLQECPKPVTKLTWDNAALLSPATAERLGFLDDLDDVDNSDVDNERPLVTLTVGEESVVLPVWVVPGHADDTVTVHFGHGRRRAGKVGDGVGVDVGPIRSSAAFWGGRARIAATGDSYPIATTQHHHSMEGRRLVRQATVDEFRANPDFAHEGGHGIDPRATLYGEPGEGVWDYPGHKWGLAVDLGACTGCNACVIACQSENNIPVVGKEQVANGREMHWLRIDRYFEGDDANHVDGVHNQPVMCMQCEQAPCEPVCPVAATVHSQEGLNDMVYNRCVGTRYCSNNCPYKVRRFNFLKYTDHTEEILKMARNPDVTVRMRGVMEKCTYCVQRISHARIKAKVAAANDPERGDDRVRDDEIQTACQQACPSNALVFGDLNDPDAAVARRAASPLNYGLLAELGTWPRTTYMAKLRNPNPALATIEAEATEETHDVS